MRTPIHRRLRLTGALALILAATGTVAACSDTGPGTEDPTDSGTSATEPAASSLLPPAEGEVTYPLTLETAWGEVTIEERPERIVAASWRGDLPWLLALGVTPVAVDSAEWALQAVPWAEDELAQPIEYTWEATDLALEPEPIAAATPDLIVAGSLGSEPVSNLDQVGAVAPVLAQPAGEADFAGWRANLLLIGEALDLTSRAQEVIDSYDEFFEGFRQEHPEFADQTIAYIGFHGGEYGAFYGNPPGSIVEEFFRRQGFADNPAGAGFNDTDAISAELVGQIDADVVVVVDYTVPEDEGREFTEWVTSPVFQSIEAAQQDRVLILRSPERTVLYDEDGAELGPMPHPSVAYDDPIGSPQFAELLAPLISETLAR
ncbi:ABC transporter substrate-binding protein [Pseudactinotalea sp.]|uniref:ABC transporter substrate-binding protein n=1 Tax=Pseudactinotalea sp. TaxID=1926260 RepID=UPI003B3AAAD9